MSISKANSQIKSIIKFPFVKKYFLVLVFFISVFCFYHIYFAKRIIPGVLLGNVSVGGMTFEKAKTALVNSFEKSERKILLKSSPYEYEITTEDIGFELYVDASVARAFEVGRIGNLYVDTKDKLAGIFKPLVIPVFYEFDDLLLGQKLAAVRGEVVKPATEAEFVLDNGSLVVTPSAIGRKVDAGDLYQFIIESFNRLDFGEKELPMEEYRPDISDADLEGVKEEMNELIFAPFKVVHKDAEWIFEELRKLEMVSFEKNRGDLELVLNKPVFEAYIEELEIEVNISPQGLVRETDGDKVLEFEIIEKGEVLDIKGFTEDFKKAFFTLRPSVDVSMQDSGFPEEASKYGIYALLGEGTSKFTGSAQARINNLTLAAERTNGILVPPGGFYSLNESVGEISGRTGYDTAWIIASGRTVLGEGGGVCQTSTTLFRAILNSGLPVVERHPHAYRVYYYEIDRPVGFDASIYQPSLDLKFKNDTPNYVLVQSEANLEEKTLTFKLYGTPDGREVEITEPVVTNVSPPPEALYTDDPSLPKGTLKQIDFAAWGANVTFSRKVTKDGEVLYEDVFGSNYRPWQAVYLKGTKD